MLVYISTKSMLNAIIKQGSASKDVGPAEERGLRARCIDLPPVPPPLAPLPARHYEHPHPLTHSALPTARRNATTPLFNTNAESRDFPIQFTQQSRIDD